MYLKVIVITHIINPHKFWFFDANTPKETLCEIVEIEEKLQDHAIPAATPPMLGELVIVKFLPWNKYIRGKIINRINGNASFHVWAIDYGFPILAKLDQLSLLPSECAKSFDFICCGGIKDVYPFNSTKWSLVACKTLKGFINKSTNISFVVNFQADDKQFWGDMAFHFSQGKDIFLQNHLISTYLADHAGINFKKNFTNMESLTVPMWLSNYFTDLSHVNDKFKNTKILEKISNWWIKATALITVDINPDPESVKRNNTPARKCLLIERYKQAMLKEEEEQEKENVDKMPVDPEPVKCNNTPARKSLVKERYMQAMLKREEEQEKVEMDKMPVDPEPVKCNNTPVRKSLLKERYIAMLKREEEQKKVEMRASMELTESKKDEKNNLSLSCQNAELTSSNASLATNCNNDKENCAKLKQINNLEPQDLDIPSIGSLNIASTDINAHLPIKKESYNSDNFNKKNEQQNCDKKNQKNQAKTEQNYRSIVPRTSRLL